LSVDLQTIDAKTTFIQELKFMANIPVITKV